MFDFLLAGKKRKKKKKRKKNHQLFSFLTSGFKHKLKSVLNFIYYFLQFRTKMLKFPKLLSRNTVNFVMAVSFSVFFRCHFLYGCIYILAKQFVLFLCSCKNPRICLSVSFSEEGLEF